MNLVVIDRLNKYCKKNLGCPNVKIDEQNWPEKVTVDFTKIGISKVVQKPQTFLVTLLSKQQLHAIPFMLNHRHEVRHLFWCK